MILALGSIHLPGAPTAITIGVSLQRLVAIASILGLTWINYRGVSLGARIQTTLTIAKVGALLALILLGLLVYRQPDVVSLNFGQFWGLPPGRWRWCHWSAPPWSARSSAAMPGTT